MSKVGDALQRKLGPLPVWAWAVIAGIGVYWYRNRSSASSLVSNTNQTPGPITPPTPQPGQVLQPGESYYDPNTGALATAPGGTTAGSSGSPTTDPGAAVANTAPTPNAPPEGVNLGVPAAAAPPPPKLSAAAIRYGTGTNRIVKPKPAGRPIREKSTTVVKPVNAKDKKRSRSAAAIRAITGGRTGRTSRTPVPVNAGKGRTSRTTAARPTISVRGRTTSPTLERPTTVRQRATAPTVGQPTTVQRPVASHTPQHAPSATSQHRPSAPPPRTTTRRRGR